MSRLDWVKESKGWRSGPYRIELVAPLLWVLSRSERPYAAQDQVVPASVETTSGSLRAAKQVAEVIEARRRHRHRIRAQLALLGLAAVALLVLAGVSVPWATSVAVVVALLWLRSVLKLLDTLVAKSHHRVKETYQ